MQKSRKKMEDRRDKFRVRKARDETRQKAENKSRKCKFKASTISKKN